MQKGLRMDSRKAVIISQSFVILALVLVISSRMDTTSENTLRIFGVDYLLLGAVVVLLISTTIILYTVQMGD